MLNEKRGTLWMRLVQVVLILILMEYAQWEYKKDMEKKVTISLNPYSNGICSMSSTIEFDMSKIIRS